MRVYLARRHWQVLRRPEEGSKGLPNSSKEVSWLTARYTSDLANSFACNGIDESYLIVIASVVVDAVRPETVGDLAWQ